MNIITSGKMSGRLIAVALAVVLIFTVVAAHTTAVDAASKKMKVTSSGVKGGWFDSAYCYRDAKGNAKTRSMPLSVKDAPEDTKYYAVYMYDKSANDFVHWLAANYKSKSFPANASKNKAKNMVQGRNDFDKVGYGAPTPPSGTGTHTYVIEVYALKDKVSLDKGFSYNEFKNAIKGKVLATATINGKCKP
ncbi:MAG: YbhB/YbcL family Raf kinase inhibitor-like protein [Clostridiales Family XIII bacterium]|nr:YbhB/YbcL family Raf kinase inhibitor-like protein [Clostridiales Family XIII bacterium]